MYKRQLLDSIQGLAPAANQLAQLLSLQHHTVAALFRLRDLHLGLSLIHICFVLVFTGLVLANEFARRTKAGGIICFLVLPAALTVYFIAIAIGEMCIRDRCMTCPFCWAS